MADQPTTPSGSRWEPTSDDATSTDPSEAGTDVQADAPIYAPATTPAAADAYGVPANGTPAPASDERRAQLRKRSILAGAATALALGGGLVGFVIGHSTAGDDTNGFRPANFSGQQHGGSFGDGQQQVPPSFGDPDGDGDHGGQGFGPPGSGSGSSSNGSSSSSGT